MMQVREPSGKLIIRHSLQVSVVRLLGELRVRSLQPRRLVRECCQL